MIAAMAVAGALHADLAAGQAVDFGPGRPLRVCADPNNLPFSNDKGEGFENKLASLIADKLGAKLVYAWFPEASGLVPNTLGSDSCDVVMGYAQGTGLIEDTNPYYYTSYVLLHRKEDQTLAGIDNLSDKRLANKKIGLFAGTPPVSILAVNGLGANAKTFEMNGEAGSPDPAERMVSEIASGQLDAGILWGPIAGYYAKTSSVPLTLVPLVKEKIGPRMLYGITLGIRPNEPQWKHRLNKLIADNQAEITAILQEYDVPVLDENGNPIKRATAER